MLSRRGLITGLISLVAAPAIVRVASLMPIKVIDDAAFEFSPFYTAYPVGSLDFAELARITRAALIPRLFVQTYQVSPLLLAFGKIDGRS